MNIMLKSIFTNNLQTFMFYSIYGFYFYLSNQKNFFVTYLKINYLFKLSFLFLWVIYFLNNTAVVYLRKTILNKNSHFFKGYNIISTYLKPAANIYYKLVYLSINIAFLFVGVIFFMFFSCYVLL